MVITIFGESCTGKSTIAEAIKDKRPARIFSGKDYLRLAKSETDAEKLFNEMLIEHMSAGEDIIYVISEKEHMRFIPNGALKVLVTADINTIKERFAQRMHGILPPKVAEALEKKHGCFDSLSCDIHIISGENTPEIISEEIIAKL